jgi:hypothetical protein
MKIERRAFKPEADPARPTDIYKIFAGSSPALPTPLSAGLFLTGADRAPLSKNLPNTFAI